MDFMHIFRHTQPSFRAESENGVLILKSLVGRAAGI
jgi:hypothetical protein